MGRDREGLIGEGEPGEGRADRGCGGPSGPQAAPVTAPLHGPLSVTRGRGLSGPQAAARAGPPPVQAESHPGSGLGARGPPPRSLTTGQTTAGPPPRTLPLPGAGVVARVQSADEAHDADNGPRRQRSYSRKLFAEVIRGQLAAAAVGRAAAASRALALTACTLQASARARARATMARASSARGRAGPA